MAAFSYHHHHPLGAAAYLPNPPSFNLPLLAPPPQHQQAADLPVPLSRFPCYYRPLDPAAAGAPAETPAVGVQTAAATVHNTAAESSSSLSSGKDHWVASSSSSSVQLSEVASRTAQSSMEKKRKERQRWNPAQSNNGKENKSRKQKKYGAALGKEAEEKKKAPREPPTGYIHVRARRGQATDSHSLAERARREKISERMKMLQGLVPGCDKVVGKALMLDEIINYVQCLQNQVEFLSMKLASVNPILFESCFDLKYMDGSEKLELVSPAVLSVQRGSNIQPTATVETTNNYPVQDASVSFLLDGLGPNAFPIQDNGNSYAMQLGDNRQRLLHQTESNMCSFQ